MTITTQPKPVGMPAWIDLMAPDADVARDFYKAVFGWEYDISGPEYGGYTTARVGPYSAAGLSGPIGDTPLPAMWSIYFASDAIEADVARAVELGATVVSPPMVVGTFGTMATCVDPAGAMFSFWKADTHVGSQITEEPGSAAWYELYTSDAGKARDFYAALLNTEVEVMPGDMEYYVLKRGEQESCGIMQIEPSWGNFPPQWGIYFSVANTDESVEVITSHGGTLMGSIDDTPFGRMAAVADPGGATFKVIQPPSS